jgi:hypothetical protein
MGYYTIFCPCQAAILSLNPVGSFVAVDVKFYILVYDVCDKFDISYYIRKYECDKELGKD